MAKELYTLNSELNTKKKIVIFGTGENAKRTYAELIHYGIKIDFFADCDNNICTEGGVKLFGIEIIKEEKLEELDCQIIIASISWQEIEKRLKKLGKKEIYVDQVSYLGLNIDI